MIEFRAVPGRTGRLLTILLRDVIGRPATGIVSYGVRVASELPTLNANAGRLNKFQELVRLREKGILVPAHSRVRGDIQGVALGRKFHHTKGLDIVYSRVNVRGMPERSDFWTQYIPKQREFRVWAFRGNVKGVYEKILRYPRRQRGRALAAHVWNWRNGYAFEFVREAPEELRRLGAAAITALDLDFGAADIIQGQDGRYYVLEVNTAPGTEGVRQGLQGIANSIIKWDASGHPRRRGDEQQGQDRNRQRAQAVLRR